MQSTVTPHRKPTAQQPKPLSGKALPAEYTVGTGLQSINSTIAKLQAQGFKLNEQGILARPKAVGLGFYDIDTQDLLVRMARQFERLEQLNPESWPNEVIRHCQVWLALMETSLDAHNAYADSEQPEVAEYLNRGAK